MAKDYRLAHERGVPVAEIVEKRRRGAEQQAISRRQFLSGAAATVAALSLPRVARAGQPRIAIVGAGVAGLNCALTLADHGVASTVYEASGRIGGRMFSNARYWQDGQVSEWCGELIDSAHAAIQSLAARFALPLDNLHAAEPAGSTETFFFRGEHYPAAQAWQDFQPIYQRVLEQNNATGYPTTYNNSTADGRRLDELSVHDWIEHYVPGGHGSPMGALLDTAYAIEFGADTIDQSALNIVYQLAPQPANGPLSLFGASDEAYHVRGGNQQIPLAIANHLGIGSVVQPGWRLEAIARNPDGRCTLTFNVHCSTKTVVADHVVLALPFAVLRRLDYSHAGFDTRKQTAIEQLGCGRNGKLQLQFASRLWNEHGPWGLSNGTSYADTGYQCSWEVSRGQPGQSGILVDYTGGASARRMNTPVAFTPLEGNAKVDADAQRFLTRLQPVLPGVPPLWNGKATSSLPHLDPHLQLSYAYWRVGQYTAFAGYEAAAQGNVHFAGEHTSIAFQGFMEGAAEEGARAAAEILNALGVAAAPREKSLSEQPRMRTRSACSTATIYASTQTTEF
jgi:monoamine oxidase